MGILYNIGKYYFLLTKVFKKPEKTKIYINRIFEEIDKIGISSIWIVIIISVFMGAVISLQTAYNLEVAYVPAYIIGLTARDSMFLEFSSTIVGLILAGKVGANIASEVGTMRINEQIDALEIMGVNSASYLIFPKIVASLITFPLLAVISMFIGVVGGYIAVLLTNAVPPADYVYGLHYYFIPFYIVYALIKIVVYAFIIVTIPAYQGYYVKGGALEVGAAGTKSVVISSILILFFNVVFTQLLLA